MNSRNARVGADREPLSQSDLVWRVVDALAQLGLRHAVLSPGYRDAPLLRAFDAHPELSTQVIVDERSAGFVALGMTRATGRPVALVCSSGSAPAHYAPAVVEAASLGLPLWILSADRPDELQRVGAAQTVAQRQLYVDHTVWRDELATQPAPDLDVPVQADRVGVRLAQAWAASVGPGGGPVHFNIPLRKPLGIGSRPPSHPPVAIHRGGPSLSARAASRLRDLASSARRALIVAGPDLGCESQSRATRDQEWSWLALSQARQWPLVADPLSPWRGAEGVLQAGDLIASTGAGALCPDLVVWIGGLPTSRALLDLIGSTTGPVVQISEHGRLIDPTYQVTDLVVAREPDAVAALARDLPTSEDAGSVARLARADPDWWPRWQKADAAAWADEPAPPGPFQWDGEAWATLFATWPGRLFHVGSSLPIRDVDAAVRLRPGQRAWGNRGANGIDGAVATSWGEAVGAGEPVLVALGDVAFAHDLGSLAQLPAEIPLAVVVLNNGGGQIFGELPLRDAEGFERLFLTPQRSSVTGLAAAAGLPAETVTSAAQLTRALQALWQQGARGLVEITVDGRVARDARRRFRERAAARVRAALGTGGPP